MPFSGKAILTTNFIVSIEVEIDILKKNVAFTKKKKSISECKEKIKKYFS